MAQNQDWEYLDADGAAREAIEAELSCELSPGHEVFGLPIEVVARRFAQDDVLVVTRGRVGVACVHLTWRGDSEPAPWPMTSWFDSAEAAMDARSA